MRANDRGNRYPSGFSHWGSSTAVSLDPDREPITRPVFVWLEIAAQLAVHGDAVGETEATPLSSRSHASPAPMDAGDAWRGRHEHGPDVMPRPFLERSLIAKWLQARRQRPAVIATRRGVATDRRPQPGGANRRRRPASIQSDHALVTWRRPSPSGSDPESRSAASNTWRSVATGCLAVPSPNQRNPEYPRARKPDVATV